MNFLGNEGEERVRAAYGQKTYARLVEVKTKYDPDNVFRMNQNIRPRCSEGRTNRGRSWPQAWFPLPRPSCRMGGRPIRLAASG